MVSNIINAIFIDLNAPCRNQKEVLKSIEFKK